MSCRSCAVGCLSFLGLVLAAGALVGAAIWIQGGRLVARTGADRPIPIDGDCPVEEVTAWVEGSTEAYIEYPLEPLEEAIDGSKGRSALGPYATADVSAIRARIEEVEGRPVPPCLEALRDEMLVMPRTMANGIAFVQDPSERPTNYRHAVMAAALLRGMRLSVNAILDAQARLSERLGVDLTELGEVGAEPLGP